MFCVNDALRTTVRKVLSEGNIEQIKYRIERKASIRLRYEFVVLFADTRSSYPVDCFL